MAQRTAICPICGAEFTTQSHNKKYCGPECKRVGVNAYQRQYYHDLKAGKRRKRLRFGARLQAAKAKHRKLRRCLRCDREFSSIGPGNRICRECQEKNRAWLEFHAVESMYVAALLGD